MSEYKFRVGDRVRVIDPFGDVWAKMGDVGTVVELDEGHGLVYIETDDGRRYGMLAKRFELAPAQFKVGDSVRITTQKPAEHCLHRFKIGDVGEITGAYSNTTSSPWHVEVKGMQQIVKEADMELLPQPESTTEGIYTGISPVMAKPFWAYPSPIDRLKTGDWNVIPEPTKKVTKENKKMTTYYRTKQNLPDLEAGAILKACGGSYTPTTDLWNTAAGDKLLQEEGQACWEKILVENSPEWFERIYEVGVLGKTKYLVKGAAQEAYAALHKAKDAK